MAAIGQKQTVNRLRLRYHSWQMISESKKREILGAFGANLNRDNPELIATYSLAELRDTEAMLGDWDLSARYRIAIRNRISELEDRKNEKQEDDSPDWIKSIAYILGSSAIFGLLKLLF